MRVEGRRWAFAAVVLGVVAHGCASTRPRTAPQRTPSARTTSSAAQRVEPPATASAAIMSEAMRGTAPACAFVSIGFDRRALPTNTSPEGFDLWVAGEADDLRRAAPEGASPRMYTEPGAGHVNALFDGATDEEVLARCERTVAAYLPTAPNLPLIGFGSAAHVTIPCRRCD